VLLLCLVSSAGVAYDLTGTFLHSKPVLEENGLAPGTSVTWRVIDPSGVLVLERTGTADGTGRAIGGSWQPTVVGTHEILIYENGGDPERETIQVREFYVLDEPYRDDFSSQARASWYAELSLDGGYAEYTNGRLNSLARTACPIIADRYRVQVTVRFPSSNNPSEPISGLLFGLSDTDNSYYMLLITPAGTFMVQRRLSSGGFETVSGMMESGHLRKGMNVSNIIRLEVEESKALILFNGKSIVSFSAPDLPGRVGFVVISYDSSTTVQFDDFSLENM
jgi:hypothetical protein